MKVIEIGPRTSARVLLIHGNDLCAEFYLPLAERLAALDVGTTLVTMPGFHHETPLGQPTWPGLVAELLACFKGGAILGHSLGSWAALLAAARQPPGLTHLLLLEPAILPWRWLQRVVMSKYRREVVDGDRRRFENWSGQYYRIHDETRFPRAAIDLYLECRRLSDPGTIRALIGQLDTLYPLPFDELAVPVRVILGAGTSRRQRSLGRLLARKLHAGVDVIPAAGHWLANEQDQPLAERIAAFLKTS